MSKLKEEIKRLKENDSPQQKQLRYEKAKLAMRKKLMDQYHKTLLQVPTTPVQPHHGKCSFSEIYIRPTITSEKEGEKGETEEVEVKTMSEIFTKNGIPQSSVYVVGGAGSGKTSFCKYLVNCWCLAHSEKLKDEIENEDGNKKHKGDIANEKVNEEHYGDFENKESKEKNGGGNNEKNGGGNANELGNEKHKEHVINVVNEDVTEEHGGDNETHGGDNEKHKGDNEEHGRENEELGGKNEEHGGDSEKHERDKEEQVGDSEKHAGETEEHGGDNEEHGRDNEEHGSYNEEHGSDIEKHRSDMEEQVCDNEGNGGDNEEHGVDNAEHGRDSEKHGADKEEQVSDNEEHAGDTEKHEGKNEKHKGDIVNEKVNVEHDGDFENKENKDKNDGGGNNNKDGCGNENEEGNDKHKEHVIDVVNEEVTKEQGSDKYNNGGDNKALRGDNETHKGDNVEHGRDNEEHGPENEEHGGDSEKHGDDSEKHGDDSEKHGDDSEKHGRDNEEHGPENEEHGGDSEKHGPDKEVQVGDNDEHAGENEGHEGDNEKHGRGNEEHGSGSEELGGDSEKKGSDSEEYGGDDAEHGSENEEHDGGAEKPSGDKKEQVGDSEENEGDSKEHRGENKKQRGENEEHKDDSVKPGADSEEHGGENVKHDGDKEGQLHDSEEHGVDKEEHGGDSKEHGGDSEKHGRDNEEHVGDIEKHRGDKEEQVSRNEEHGCDIEEHGCDSEKHGCDTERNGGDNYEHEVNSEERGGDNEENGGDSEKHGRDNDKHGVDTEKHRSGKEEQEGYSEGHDSNTEKPDGDSEEHGDDSEKHRSDNKEHNFDSGKHFWDSVKHGGANEEHGGDNKGHEGNKHGDDKEEQVGKNEKHGGDSIEHGGDNEKHGVDSGKHGRDNEKHGGDKEEQEGYSEGHDGNSEEHGGVSEKHGCENDDYGGENEGHGGDNDKHGHDNEKHGDDSEKHEIDCWKNVVDKEEHGCDSDRHYCDSVKHKNANEKHGCANEEHKADLLKHFGDNEKHGVDTAKHVDDCKEHRRNNKENEGDNEEHGAGREKHRSESEKHGGDNVENGGAKEKHGGLNEEMIKMWDEFSFQIQREQAGLCGTKTNEIEGKNYTKEELDYDSKTYEQKFMGVKVMKKFEFVFYIPLRQYQDIDIDIMLQKRYQMDILSTLIEKESSRVMILLDGIDEWSCENVPDHSKFKEYTIVTTSRPWKFFTLRSIGVDIKQSLKLKGFDFKCEREMVNRTVSQLNNRKHANKDARDCRAKLREKSLGSLKQVPIILQQLICLWYDDKLDKTSRAAIYTGMLELFFAWNDMKTAQTNGRDKGKKEVNLPKYLADKTKLQFYRHFIYDMSQLAYKTLFNCPKNKSLAFDICLLDKLDISDEVRENCLKLGIMTEDERPNFTVSEPSSSLFSFIHKSMQEFLAAVNICINFNTEIASLNSTGNDELAKSCYEIIEGVFQKCMKCIRVNDILEQSSVMIMLCGLEPKLATHVSKFIFDTVSKDSRVKEYRRTVNTQTDLFYTDSESRNINILFTDIHQLVFALIEECKDSSSPAFYLGDLIIDELNQFCDNVYSRIDLKQIATDSVLSIRVNYSNTDNVIFIKYLPMFQHLEKLEMTFQSAIQRQLFSSTQNDNTIQSYTKMIDEINKCTSEIIKKNTLTLISLSLSLAYFPVCRTVVKNLPRMKNLVAIRMSYIKMSHDDTTTFCNFLEGISKLEQIHLHEVRCDCFKQHDVNLSRCLKYLYLCDAVSVKDVDTTNLEIFRYTHLKRCNYKKIFEIIRKSNKLKELELHADRDLKSHLYHTMIGESLVKVHNLRMLRLYDFRLTNNIIQSPLQMNSLKDIELYYVTMTLTTWQKFVDSLPSIPHTVNVKVLKCCITDDGEIELNDDEQDSPFIGSKGNDAKQYVVKDQDKLFHIKPDDIFVYFHSSFDFSTKK